MPPKKTAPKTTAKNNEVEVNELEKVIEKLETNFDDKTLVGDIRDAMLEMFKHRPKAWQSMTEDEQHEMVDFIQFGARSFVDRSIEIIRGDGEKSVRAMLEKYADKGEITVTLKISRSALADGDNIIRTLHECVGKNVMIIPASVEDYNGEKAPVEIDSDQPDFGGSFGE